MSLNEHVFDCCADALSRKDITACLMPPSYLRHIACVAKFSTCDAEADYISVSSRIVLATLLENIPRIRTLDIEFHVYSVGTIDRDNRWWTVFDILHTVPISGLVTSNHFPSTKSRCIASISSPFSASQLPLLCQFQRLVPKMLRGSPRERQYCSKVRPPRISTNFRF